MQQSKSALLHAGRVLGWGIAVLLVWKLGFVWGSVVGSAVSLGILAGSKKMKWGNPFISSLKDGMGVSIVLAVVIFGCKLLGAALSVITTIVWGIFLVFVIIGLRALVALSAAFVSPQARAEHGELQEPSAQALLLILILINL